MSGLNRFYLKDESSILWRKNYGIKCVFISHQKDDASICKKIADYFINAGIDVYFDEYDSDLKIHRQTNNPQWVVDAIKKGINKSSHMLCVFSPNTLYSKWVPWEIGYGYDKTNLSALTLKGITDNQLPEYLKTVPIIRGTKTLNDYISTIEGKPLYRMFSDSLLTEHTKTHPLDNYLDYNL
ncbi:MAG: toll/interleukin-1 receptor domain-containing protein [Eubacteriales bacterium]|nr:toll/interleukin-1 receptor domain-containing protein [Eubacteriales bacterium]MDD4476343.1 toll/interleukin-1 receptor domain-containing protein [Eubacteriales bacterium]